MRYLKKYNESKGDIKDLDWSLIKDCLLEVFDSVDNIKGCYLSSTSSKSKNNK
jgi:hypothetical protein